MLEEDIDIINLLEDYCRQKIRDSDYKNKSGFEIERIVFTYLDYLLYRDGYKYDQKQVIEPLQKKWKFQFRTSIEHFSPQNPTEGKPWELKELNSFGNLALITISGNSKFSNLYPSAKVSSYPSIIAQSNKLNIMEFMIREDSKWTEEKANRHKKEMFNVFISDGL